MPNSKKPSNDDNLSFEERVAKHKSRLADAPAYTHHYLDDNGAGDGGFADISQGLTNYAEQNFQPSAKRDFSQLKRHKTTQNSPSNTQNETSDGVEVQIDFSDELSNIPSNHTNANNANAATNLTHIELSDVAIHELDFSDNANASANSPSVAVPAFAKNHKDNKKQPDGNQQTESQKTNHSKTDNLKADNIKADNAKADNVKADNQKPDALKSDNESTSQQANAKPAYIKIDPKQKVAKTTKKDKIVLTNKSLSATKVGAVMAVSLLLITWLKQDRLADYWQQTYQSGEPWTTLASVGGWQSGEKVGHSLGIDGVNAGLASVGQKGQDVLNNAFFAEKLAQQEQAKKATNANLANTNTNTNNANGANADTIAGISSANKADNQNADTASTPTQTQIAPKSDKPLEHITLHAGQKVLFAGDSMMQGVAPWVMRKLKSDYHIDSMDLSKQSTGLSYSSFFDWPATIEKAFADHSEIGALVIYLGANDPWAVPNPANKAAKYIDFATDEWTVLYHEKMRRILDNAKSHGVQVIWITPPTMKKPKLNEQMKVLTEIMHRGIDKTQVVVMDSKPLLSPSDDYTDTIVIGDKTTKVRTADGIHFTTDGQKHLANHILARIKTEP